MPNNETVKMHPVQMAKEALSLWGANIIPLVAISATIALAHKAFGVVLYSTGPIQEAMKSGEINLTASLLFGVFVLVSFVVNCFLSLVAINTLRRRVEKKSFLFEAFKDAARRAVPFLKSIFFIFGFVLVGIFVALSFLAGGKAVYALAAKSLGHGLALGALLATSTVFVVLAIGVAWYGFFFSLAPLVAAYENIPAFNSLRASRDRVRGNALRYLGAMAIFVGAYFIVGLAIYGVIIRFTHDKYILNLIDPALLLFFGPLGLSIWYVSYKKLTQIKVS
ncbi:MAG TPA: hypothetical protein DCL35_07945 [Candidatus Omnitrophica bacterium]|nr:hypothetical protein [Candidatus Omnitrophota bacterium]